MALPLNIFKTAAAVITTTPTSVYTAPPGYSAIVLMAQVTNVTTETAQVTVLHSDVSTSIDTELLKDFSIPGNDATSATTGKLVLETGDSVKVHASANNTLKIVLSILESANG
jgi:hypothetical protein